MIVRNGKKLTSHQRSMFFAPTMFTYTMSSASKEGSLAAPAGAAEGSDAPSGGTAPRSRPPSRNPASRYWVSLCRAGFSSTCASSTPIIPINLLLRFPSHHAMRTRQETCISEAADQYCACAYVSLCLWVLLEGAPHQAVIYNF